MCVNYIYSATSSNKSQFGEHMSECKSYTIEQQAKDKVTDQFIEFIEIHNKAQERINRDHASGKYQYVVTEYKPMPTLELSSEYMDLLYNSVPIQFDKDKTNE